MNYNDTTKKVLLVVASTSTPFQDWIAGTSGHFPGETNPAIVGKHADPDGDGVDNITEFALDGIPNSAAANTKVVGKIADVGDFPTLVLSLPVREGVTSFSQPGLPGNGELVSNLDVVDGVTYKIQGSDDLGTWTLDVAELLTGNN